jgi:3-isopropylmalate/(R)-2-methylmalate dehydratase small subunit
VKISGPVLKYGDNIDTDAIIPARYLNTSDPEELARHCMEDIDPDFPKRMKRGSILVAGRNFGGGSSREHAPIALIGAGVAGVVAAGFARIFYRNAVNTGLPILECREAADAAREGDVLEVDLATGAIRNMTQGATFKAEPFPPFVEEIILAGGLVEALKKKMKAKRTVRHKA